MPHHLRRLGLRSLLSLCTLGVLGLGAGLLPALQASGKADPPPKVERLAIVDKAIEYHGGDLYRSSRTRLEICSKSGCFRLAVTMDGDLFDYQVENESQGAKVETRLSNESVERHRDGEPVAIPEGEAQRVRDFVNARVYFPFLPFRLNDPSTFKRDLGLETWGERQLHKVEVSFAAGSSTDADDVYLYWFDPQTGRLEQFAYSYGEAEEAGLRFRRLFNYRRVGGILFADQTNLGAEAPGIRVHRATPEFVESEMREVSTIRLRDVRVEILEP